jgi:predicted permease
MRDFRYAFRTLARNPGFSLAAILVLALGIGANSAIFTVIRAVLLAPLPYPDPDRLVNLYERDVIGPSDFNIVSGLNFEDWQREAKSFEQMAIYGEWISSFAPDDGGLPENIDGAICSSNLFATLGVRPAIGRSFTAEEDQFAGPPVVMISDALWKRRFSARPDVIGARIRLDGEPRTVVGVMPAGFHYPFADSQLWLPARQVVPERQMQSRGNHRFYAIARLKPGISAGQARTEIDGIARRIYLANPKDLTGKGGNVVRMDERMVHSVRPMLLVLLGAVACVLLIACVNVTNLLLARAVSRRREVAVRVAVGASRGQILKQFLIESSILSFGGAALGLAMASLTTDFLIQMAGAIPRIEDVHVNATVLAFTAGIAILTGIAVGFVPALSSWRAGLATAMQEGGRSATAGRGRGLFRDALVAVEVALSLMLLAGAGLMLKSFSKLRTVDPGFRTDRVLTIHFSLPALPQKPNQGLGFTQAAEQAHAAQFFSDVLAQTRALPGVESAGIVTVAPLGGHYMDTTFTIEGRPPLPAGQFLDAIWRFADPGYFKAMGIPLQRGRTFTDAERLDAANKAIITQSMAARFFPNQDPIGKHLLLGEKSYEIVGIAGDTRQYLPQRAEPMMYMPLYDGTFRFATLMVRTQGDPNLLSLPIQKIMRGLAADLPAVTVKTVDEMMEGAAGQNRFGLTLIALFAALAVILASIGLYGVLAYSVGQRTNEIGIRMALGAASREITRLVVWQGFKPAAAGIAAGLAGAVAATRLLQSLLFEVSPADPLVMTTVALLIAVIAAAASFIPAWRATRIDPVAALRAE